MRMKLTTYLEIIFRGYSRRRWHAQGIQPPSAPPLLRDPQMGQNGTTVPCQIETRLEEAWRPPWLHLLLPLFMVERAGC